MPYWTDIAIYSYTPKLESLVMDTLNRYLDALEDGTAKDLYPAVGHAWTYFEDSKEKPMTIERLRSGLENLDAYLNNSSQHNWAESNQTKERGYPVKFDSGPDFSRLPDAAVWALFAELDAIFFEHLVVPDRTKPAMPAITDYDGGMEA